MVSYPKSGNTWMRFLLINSVFNKDKSLVSYNDLEKYIPSIHRSSKADIDNIKGFRIIKSHFVKKEYPKIVYLIRDGRDALVSYYFFQKDVYDFQGTFAEFYFHEGYGKIGSWDKHVKKALDYQINNPDNIIIIRYEDLINDTENTLINVLNFLGQKTTPKQLAWAIENSSFHKLQKMQSEEAIVIDDKNVNFFRKGRSNQWPSYFTEKMLLDFELKAGDILNQFKYSN
ncbi:sulfotransferase domain-containing protein [Aureitalea sp. L0-47]|nr:sulfotransferase domain-containing protein [Aureitalea sp. L0-47]